MVAISITYEGQLRTRAIHGPSGTALHTDAPRDNHGRGESFSPTDLVATALGSCMLTIMGIAANKLKIAMEGATVTVEKEMVTSPVRRIGALKVVIRVSGALDAAQQQALRDAALSCPVHQSLHPDVAIPVEFVWGA